MSGMEVILWIGQKYLLDCIPFLGSIDNIVVVLINIHGIIIIFCNFFLFLFSLIVMWLLYPINQYFTPCIGSKICVIPPPSFIFVIDIVFYCFVMCFVECR